MLQSAFHFHVDGLRGCWLSLNIRKFIMDALEDLDAGVTTYSGMFNAFHDIIHPRKAAKEFRVEVQSPITKQFGLTHA